jgi:hypothetical protein
MAAAIKWISLIPSEELCSFHRAHVNKKLANLWAALALHFAYYNFCWVHRTPQVTPAMGGGHYGSRLRTG